MLIERFVAKSDLDTKKYLKSTMQKLKVDHKLTFCFTDFELYT